MRPIVSLQRLTQKSLNMEVIFNVKKLHLTGSEINWGKPAKIFVQIVRGPQTWRSKNYEMDAETTAIEFQNEQFKRKSGFYFTKGTPEVKKANFTFFKVIDGEEEEPICSAEVNLSHLIGINPTETHVQVSQKGINDLDISGHVCPMDGDHEYIEEYLRKAREEDAIPPLQPQDGLKSGRPLLDLFDKMHRETDHEIQEEVNSLAEQERDLDDKLNQMRA